MLEGPRRSRWLTSHPPVLLQLPGGYKHSDLSVSSVPEILHRHGDATAGEKVLEAMPVGVVESKEHIPAQEMAQPPHASLEPARAAQRATPGHQRQHHKH